MRYRQTINHRDEVADYFAWRGELEAGPTHQVARPDFHPASAATLGREVRRATALAAASVDHILLMRREIMALVEMCMLMAQKGRSWWQRVT